MIAPGSSAAPKPNSAWICCAAAALLHPRGDRQVQDIFGSNIKDYALGFRGPGKLDGSFVTWVNGAFLHAVGARAGYHVNFAPFPYRKGSKTQVLYTTRRD